MKLNVGDIAPEIKLPDQDGNFHSLKDYKGKMVFIYFYPKDFTPGCTVEACSLRDNYSKIKNLGVAVIGISADSVDRHKKFAEKHRLPFILLSDTKKQVLKSYGVWQKKKFMGREFMGTVRNSFLIDSLGNIVKIYEKVNPKNHVEEVKKDIKSLIK